VIDAPRQWPAEYLASALDLTANRVLAVVGCRESNRFVV